MKDSEIRQLDMAQRVSEFAKTHAADFPAGSRGAELITSLDAAIASTEQQAAKQDAAALDRQENTEQKQDAINTLLEQMRAISRTARSINQHFPGIGDQFKMPRDIDQAILNRARAFIEAATPIASEFTSRGLPAGFLIDLQAAIDASDAAENSQSAALANQTAATAGVAAALKQVTTIMRELDAVMLNKYRADPSQLAAWKSASRVEKAPKKKETETPPPPAS